MKINYKLLWLWTLLTAFLLGSCEREDMKPESQLTGDKRVAPVLTSIPASNFVLQEEDKNKTLTNAFSWQAANFDLFIHADVVYTLELDKNANFSAPKTLFSGTQRSFSIKVGDLNKLLISMGVETTTPISFRVKAEVKNSQIQPLISNVLTLPVTPYIAFDKMVLNGTATQEQDIVMANVGGNTHRWTVIADLKPGKVRFIGDARFVFGGNDFPAGKAVRDGAEINIPEAGRYRVDFDDQTLDYKFAFGYERVGIIGSGTTGNDTGWGQDIAMKKNGNDWSLYIYLYQGEVKFRANNSWAVNWGGNDFPEGTGTQDGPNIKINNAGWYFVQFNDLTGAYKFTSVKVGIIGDATPGGWGTPTFMNPAGGRNWSIGINLEAKEMKFRLGDEWTVNWGGTGFPTGVGTQDGPNIKIPNAGFYVINFNDETGEYSFSTGFDRVGIIGNATTGSHDTGWAQDIEMQKNQNNPAEWSITIYLYQGEAKFRANGSWDINWGANSFPTGTGVQNGPNIPIAEAGYYRVVFNSATGAYTFTKLTPTVYNTVGIIGSATANGWSSSTPMTRDANNQHKWSLTLELSDKEVKFRANDSWDVNWGGSSFPTGYGVQDGPNIKIPSAGIYKVTFDDVTGYYSFVKEGEGSGGDSQGPQTIGIIGSATYFGWGRDIDLQKDGSNPDVWKGRTYLTVGEAKFRADDSWDVNWGGTGFPNGVGTSGGPNIPVGTEGYYDVSINIKTGEYTFTLLDINSLTKYNAIGLIGSATPNGWGGDTPMTASTSNPHLWTVTVTLTQDEAKFRANNAWDVNWGANGFPADIGYQNGPNIPIGEAGSYKVTFDSVTGYYKFEKQ